MTKGTLPELTPEQARVIATLTPAQRIALAGRAARCVRRRSAREFLGLPLYSIACGPDPDRREARGHAIGVIAIGDIATGIVAIGGWARGVVAFGGLATGVVSIGGLALSLLLSFGGGAVSGGLAIGGGAIGPIATGGGAVGYYAIGAGAIGEHVVSATRQDPEALALFRRFGLEPPAGPRQRWR